MTEKNFLDLDRNTASALAYVGFWVTGLIFLLLEKNDKLIRFHALQSIIVFGILTLFRLIPFFGDIFSPFIYLLTFIIWLICIVKAYQGEEFLLPFAGQLAKKQLKKI